MSRYLIVDLDTESVVLQKEQGLYDNLEEAKDDMMTVAYRENRWELLLYQLQSTALLGALDLEEEYHFCKHCQVAFHESACCPRCGGEPDGDG